MRTLCKTILAAAFAAVLSANATDVSVASFCERANKGDRLGSGGGQTPQNARFTGLSAISTL